MEPILRVFQVLLAIGLIAVVLLQRSEGGGLGIGSSGGMGSFMSVRGTANFLTRMTSILGGLFMLTCLGLALIAHPSTAPRSIFDVPAPPTSPAPLPPVSQTPLPVPAPIEKPAETGAPTAPVAPDATATVPAPVVVPPVVATPTTEIPAPTPPKATPKAPEHKAKKSSHKAATQPSGQ